MQRGEVWWAGLGAPRGSAPGYERPVLIVQDDDFNRSPIRTVVIAAITSNLGRAEAPGNVWVDPRVSGLPRPSVVNVSQLATIDKRMLRRKAKTLDTKTMETVDAGLALVLGLKQRAR